MILIPALDLRGGKCVQLVQGKKGSEQVVLDNPVSIALDWQRKGARLLHVVDLDAAFGEGNNGAIIKECISALSIPVHVGGGIRSAAAVEKLLRYGASRVIVGTKAIKDRRWLEEIARAHPNKIVVAVDAKRYDIVTNGWTESTGKNVIEFAAELETLPLAGLLYTNVAIEGLMKGIELKPIRELTLAVSMPVIVSGGIASLEDIKALASLNVWGAVVGMAFYTGKIDFNEAMEAVT